MDKANLETYIKKYHLGGIVESVIWTVESGICEIKFLSNVSSTAGFIVFPFVGLSKIEEKFGVNTSPLIKLLSILKDDISISLIKEHNVWMKMEISDDVYQQIFSLSDISAIKPAPSIQEPKVYEVSFPLDKEFKEQYLKAYKALDGVDRVSIKADKSIKITLGAKESYGNKISFERKSTDYLPLKTLAFSGTALAEILKNNTDFSNSLLEVSAEGLLKIRISEVNCTVIYYIVEKEEV